MSSSLSRMLPGDSKSQNSDYGSLRHTPYGGSGGSVPGTETATSGQSQEQQPADGIGDDPVGGGGGAGGDTADSPPGLDSQQREPLLNSTHHDPCSSDDEAGGPNSSGYTRRKSRKPAASASARIDLETNDSGLGGDFEDINNGLNDIPAEPLKTLLAFVFLFFAWVATTTSLALTHERVPDVPPLPGN